MINLLLGLFGGLAVMGWFWLRAIQQARVLEEEKQLVTQEKDIVVEFMHHMVQAIGEGITRDELFQRIVHAAVVSTGALSACIFEKLPDGRLRGVAVEGLFPPHRPLPEQSKMKLTTRARFIEQVLRSETFEVGEGIVGRVAATGQAILVRNAEADPAIVKHDDPALAVKSVIAAPIVFRGELIGVLAVANPADGLPFSETDLSLVQSLAEQSGLAVHNQEFLKLSIEKKQLDIDIALASSVQTMILPQVFPQIVGLDLDAFFRPAQRLGGDLYEAFLLPDGRLALAVADVSGKGIAASIIMAICRTNLRRIAPHEPSPAGTLRELNRVMQGDMREDMYITLVLAYADIGSGSITFARAGHELPLLCRRDADAVAVVEAQGAEGMPVGMVAPEIFDEIIAERTFPFEVGDVFCLYTDGVTEAACEGKEFGAARLADALKTLRQRSAREINAGILESVQRFTGSDTYGDDFTLLTVRRTA